MIRKAPCSSRVKQHPESNTAALVCAVTFASDLLQQHTMHGTHRDTIDSSTPVHNLTK
jgi:hypothetical protein